MALVRTPSDGERRENLLHTCIYTLMCLYVGTDATHAEHIETIKNRNYVGVQTDGHFVPGELGMGLVEGQYHVWEIYMYVHM